MFINILAGWIAIFVGVITGLITGIFFHKDDFLGGYDSWTRRLMRLGHVSFFGLGFVNILFFVTVNAVGIESDIRLSSILFVVGLITMPLVCYLSAFKKNFRQLFFIPVLSVLIATAVFVWKLVAI